MLESEYLVEVEPAGSKPKQFIFVLLNDFTMLCFACAIEALRIANRMSGKSLYSWKVAGEGGEGPVGHAGAVQTAPLFRHVAAGAGAASGGHDDRCNLHAPVIAVPVSRTMARWDRAHLIKNCAMGE